MYPWLRALFPLSRVILLVRDPFDVLDSYLDLQKPGSWNQSFGDPATAGNPVRVRNTAEHIRDTLATALQTFDQFPAEQRLQLSYEELLRNPLPGLLACGRLMSVEMTPELAQTAAAKHAFEKYEQTGPLQFRRQGKAGTWQSSANFTPEVTAIAEEILGPLRRRLGYPV
jgi:hypothetical protein